jgi:hypothetical protein
VTGSSAVEQPTAEQPTAEQPTVEQPAVEQTPAAALPATNAASQRPSGPGPAGNGTGTASMPPRSPAPLPTTPGASPPSPAGAESAAVSARKDLAGRSPGTDRKSVSSVPGRPATDGGWTRRVGDTVGRIVHEVVETLREVSLKDLALAALPGIAGLMFLFALGVGLGHRQARFTFSLDTGGALRFAVHGPLGVVRSGQLISVRTRRLGDEVRRARDQAA